MDLWSPAVGHDKKINLNKIQTHQNITLRQLTNSPPYISNFTLHNDLNLKTIENEAITIYKYFFYVWKIIIIP